MMYNPRWPFIFTAYRQALDANGLPVTDENGDPVSSVIPLERVICDSAGNPLKGADGVFRTETVTEMPWGYRTSTGGIKDSGDVFQLDFKISCPKFVTHLPEGTILKLTDDDHTFHAVVKKKTSYNWGSNIWIDELGNDGKV